VGIASYMNVRAMVDATVLKEVLGEVCTMILREILVLMMSCDSLRECCCEYDALKGL